MLTASVVIPAWNALGMLAQCLIAIEQSSFNRKYQEKPEAIVVDDDFTDETRELPIECL
ncbi:MAG TPA: glycosyltransferase [Ktedonobacteraceae bacterium]|nr:glycosyltransferase [Ktedonobacteraceae bacterium]